MKRNDFIVSKIVELASKDSDIDISFFENSETKYTGSLGYDLSVVHAQHFL